MKLYRVEYLPLPPVSVGPYGPVGLLDLVGDEEFLRLDDFAKEIGSAHRYSWDHPTPNMDGIYKTTENERCAFQTLDQLYDWFGNWAEKLADHGFGIRVYKIHKAFIHFGWEQVMAPITARHFAHIMEWR